MNIVVTFMFLKHVLFNVDVAQHFVFKLLNTSGRKSHDIYQPAAVRDEMIHEIAHHHHRHQNDRGRLLEIMKGTWTRGEERRDDDAAAWYEMTSLDETR